MRGLRAGIVCDPEVYISFLEADLYFFHSGYAKWEKLEVRLNSSDVRPALRAKWMWGACKKK